MLSSDSFIFQEVQSNSLEENLENGFFKCFKNF